MIASAFRNDPGTPCTELADGPSGGWVPNEAIATLTVAKPFLRATVFAPERERRGNLFLSGVSQCKFYSKTIERGKTRQEISPSPLPKKRPAC